MWAFPGQFGSLVQAGVFVGRDDVELFPLAEGALLCCGCVGVGSFQYLPVECVLSVFVLQFPDLFCQSCSLTFVSVGKTLLV